MNKNKKTISWTTTDRPIYHRGKLWYVIALTVVAGLFIGSLLFRAYTFSLVIIAITTVYVIIENNDPQKIKIRLGQYDISIGKKKYPYSQIKSFSIVTESLAKDLYLKVPSDIAFNIRIDLENKNPNEIKKFLISKIPEESKNLPILDTLLRILKI